jgi:hypothetical protein
LVHLLLSSSLLHCSPLHVVALASLSFLYSCLNREDIHHIQVFSFLPLALSPKRTRYLSQTWITNLSQLRIFLEIEQSAKRQQKSFAISELFPCSLPAVD